MFELLLEEEDVLLVLGDDAGELDLTAFGESA